MTEMKLPSSLPLVEANIPFLTKAPLSLDRAIQMVESPKYGAIATFSGCIRNEEKKNPIQSITYQAYRDMAEKELSKLRDQAQLRWEAKCFVQHRIGRVQVGEASVVIACAAPHRKEAFEACQFIINEIKSGVPIWKVEFK